MGNQMDIKTRGVISSIINNSFETQKVLETIKWILETDDDVVCKEDLALGYFIGSLMNISSNTWSRLKKEEIVENYYKKSLEKTYGKKQGKIKYLEYKMRMEENNENEKSQVIVELPNEEVEKIRNMLIPMIPKFREKIRQENILHKI